MHKNSHLQIFRWYILLFLCSIQSVAVADVFPIFDHEWSDWPYRFRITKNEEQVVPEEKRVGLADLRASGSAQFSKEALIALAKEIPSSQILVIDLRQESHGFINERAISWFDGKHNQENCDKTLEMIEQDETDKLQQALKEGMLKISCKITGREEDIEVKEAQTEKEVAESIGLNYLRIPVLDHNRPSDKAVDQFVDLIKTLPSETWLHFHCRGGKGRTTTFLILYDMMLNHDSISCNAIIERHRLIGGSDLTQIRAPDTYGHLPSIERFNFIQHFYQYCREVPQFDLKWSEWIANQKDNLVSLPAGRKSLQED